MKSPKFLRGPVFCYIVFYIMERKRRKATGLIKTISPSLIMHYPKGYLNF